MQALHGSRARKYSPSSACTTLRKRDRIRTFGISKHADRDWFAEKCADRIGGLSAGGVSERRVREQQQLQARNRAHDQDGQVHRSGATPSPPAPYKPTWLLFLFTARDLVRPPTSSHSISRQVLLPDLGQLPNGVSSGWTGPGTERKDWWTHAARVSTDATHPDTGTIMSWSVSGVAMQMKFMF